MILNYLKLSLRLLARNPFFTFINVAGLCVGFATFLLLWPYAEYELKSDQYHPDADRIVRLAVDFKWTDNGENWNGFLGAFNSWGVAHEIEKKFPQVEAVTRVVDQLNFNKSRQGIDRDFFISIIDNKEKRVTYRETQTIFAEPDFFQFFSIPLLAGEAQTVFSDPNVVVISESTSKKYFGEEPAVGKTIYLNDSIPVKVTGVFKDLPSNTHLRFSLVFSVVGKKGYDISSWNGWAGYCYMKLEKGYDFKTFQKDLDARKAELYEFVKYGCAHCDWNSFVQPLSEVVFSDLRGNSFHSKSKFLLEGLYAVSFIVLLLAWINYITLSIHSLTKRLSELATRKVVGAGTREFSVQFLVESVTINLISFAAALTLFQLLKNPAEQWLGLYIPRWDELSGKIILIVSLTFMAGVLLTAFYPLLIIRKRSVNELFKKSKNGIKHSFASTALVTFQYAAAIVLLIWIVTSNMQISYILEKDIGIKKDGVIVVDGSLRINHYDDSKISSFLQETKRIKGINQSSVSYSLVGEPDVKGLVIQRSTDSNFVGVDTNGGVDENFLATFQIPLLAGRNFLPDNPADKNSLLISIALVKRLGFASAEEALGQRVMLPDFRSMNVEIIGVISDYEFRPFFNDATEHNRGIALMYKNYLVPYFKPLKLSISIAMSDFKDVLEKVETLHQSLFPEETFKWYWLDEKIERQYTNEKMAKNQITFFTILAIGISCLGLLGLISNKAVEKTKEIGIRKVMGAQLYQIAQILLNTTVKQILIATVIGIPLAYYLTQKYLEKFSERITLLWWYFTLPVIILMMIMLVTVASVLWKAAKSNPVEALKYE